MTKRRAETRRRLIGAAVEVFADKGYGQVTIKDVCTAAGYTRGAFYSQFDSLEELLFVVYRQWTTQIAAQVRDALDAAEPATGITKTVARVMESLLFQRDWLLVKADLLSVAARNPELAHRWSVHRGQLRLMIEELVTASGVELADSAGSASDTARSIIAIYDGLGTQVLLDNDGAGAHASLTRLLSALLPPAAS
ncbi:TetR/AcrR family transcriptional regulator [Mycobacterium sp. ML4]